MEANQRAQILIKKTYTLNLLIREKEMHAILTGYSNPEKNIKLNQIEKWTDFLYSTNKEQKTFTPASFKKILNYRLQRVEEKINCFKS